MDEMTTYEQAQRAELEDQARYLESLSPTPTPPSLCRGPAAGSTTQSLPP